MIGFKDRKDVPRLINVSGTQVLVSEMFHICSFGRTKDFTRNDYVNNKPYLIR